MVNTVLPVFLLAALGWVARRYLKVEVKDPATISIYLMSPGLIMNSILKTHLVPSELGKIILFAVTMAGAMLLITLITGRSLGWQQQETSAAMLSTIFMNAANYGLPLVLLAFGQEGFDRAAIFVVAQQMMMYTLGVFIAARGRLSWRSALIAMFRMPMIWAALAAVAIRLSGITLPNSVMQPIGMLADGALVLVIILLGMQVAGIRLQGARVQVGVTSLLRLVISPLVALGVVALLRPEPLTASVLVLEASLPAAVNTALLAVQFDSEPEQVSGVTLVTTLLSLATVSFWVWFLQGPA